jgi:hypothetical protein
MDPFFLEKQGATEMHIADNQKVLFDVSTPTLLSKIQTA